MFSLKYLQELRAVEIDIIMAHLRPAGAHLLEIGAGTGQQAREIERRGFKVDAIEVCDSIYSDERVFPIVNFDGRNIPFEDNTFDIVFSSNVLEHVPDLVKIHQEIRRVLKPTGYVLHILPTHSWRFWTTLSAFAAAFQYASTLGSQLSPPRSITRASIKQFAAAWGIAGRHLLAPCFQRRHGARGNILSETWLFNPEWWRRNFKTNGFNIIMDKPMGLFYTGNMVFNSNWSFERRARISRVLGSACHIFELKSIDTTKG
ncbi:class I SAM-dependent methyltransferase [Solidesulfovibrio carbinolicus]|uniref:Methyltransferase type 11 domain-containing protein n=1 Tax=Solidesulfovibrio carbinolicus TaxID=296842 RepID=A0A4P6I635_9BACT|nr:class I SAM-dependent methyltransferase [Solidesulfovibrio carbinolicus]QAZ69589.1 hypothetical protein C3Y92_20095 [Solidesulfovibrio carbinolicus]